MIHKLPLDAFTRFVTRRPGYDCVRNPCWKMPAAVVGSCGHGIGSEVWWFSLASRDGTRAISLAMLMLDRYPDSVPPERHDRPMPLGLNTHRKVTPNSRARGAAPCELLGGKCVGGTLFSSVAEEVWAYGNPKDIEQSEAFWAALGEHMP